MELKKNPKLDYQKKYVLFFNIGLVLSLLFVISAFEWKVENSYSRVDLMDDPYGEEIAIIQITHINPPPKPKIKQITLIEIDDDKEVEEIEISFDAIDIVEIVVANMDEPPEEVVEVVKDFVETMPSFPGGLSEFYKFVRKNLDYPAQARRLQIEGKVFVHFVVDKNGGLSDIKIVRGIGAGCDNEVLRIINISPKWNPGKQRGRPVNVRMMMPITFRLQ